MNIDGFISKSTPLIFDLLPHRYPFLLVDRVLSFEPMKSIHAIKSVSINEPFFQGHFLFYPVMSGVLILEALAQAGGIMVIKSLPGANTMRKMEVVSTSTGIFKYSDEKLPKKA